MTTARLEWIAKECGGRSKLPSDGYRATVRWQNFWEEWLSVGGYDAEIFFPEPRPQSRIQVSRIRFWEGSTLDEKYLAVGEPIELLEGVKVVAVGVIIESA
jgi:hypothetical protein